MFIGFFCFFQIGGWRFQFGGEEVGISQDCIVNGSQFGFGDYQVIVMFVDLFDDVENFLGLFQMVYGQKQYLDGIVWCFFYQLFVYFFDVMGEIIIQIIYLCWNQVYIGIDGFGIV